MGSDSHPPRDSPATKSPMLGQAAQLWGTERAGPALEPSLRSGAAPRCGPVGEPPGSRRARAICAALAVSPAVQGAAGNGLEEQAAQCLAELLLAHRLKSLDLSYNQLNDQAGMPSGCRPGSTAALLIVFLGQAGQRWGPGPSKHPCPLLSCTPHPGLSARSQTSLCPALPVGPDGH